MRTLGMVLVPLAIYMFGCILPPPATADTLGNADSFAVLAGSTVTNAAYPTAIQGNLGVSPGTAVTGFPPGIVTDGLIYTGTNAVVEGAQSDLTTAFNTESGLAVTGTYASGVLPTSLGPGVYSVGAGTNLTGTLTLTDGGVGGSIFVFLFSSTLITASNSVVNVSGLQPSDSIFWVVDSSATLGNNTVFEGNILASGSISFDPGATDDCGRALAENGEVAFAGQDPTSLVQNSVSFGCTSNGFNGTGGGGGPVPEPSALELALTGLFAIFCLSAMRRRKQTARSMGFC